MQTTQIKTTAAAISPKRRVRCTNAQPLDAANLPAALLKVDTVVAVTGLSPASIFRKTAAKQFPEPIRLGARCTRWKSADVRAWIVGQTATVAATAK